MSTQKLNRAREYEARKDAEIPAEERPLFHLSSRCGWMNDPNGFSFYDGMYHLFYQYYPYEPVWGPMHWGHAVSHDLITWQYRPAALAPDTPADCEGCFSGSALTHDGQHMLMYTGVMPDDKDPAKQVQVQCLAFGDGQELFLITNGLTVSDHGTMFLSRYGCEENFRHNKDLMIYDKEKEIDKILEDMELSEY